MKTMRGAMPITLLASLVTIASPALAVWGMPEGVTDRMDIINDIYGQIMLAGVLVFLFVMGWMLVAMIRFRPGGAGQRTNEEHRGSIKAELVWTIIPFLIVAWVGVISFDGLMAIRVGPDEAPDDAVEIKVTGFQWFWQVEYENGLVKSMLPADDGSLDQAEPFRLPAGKTVIFNITAGDSQHALWIPDLGVKEDAYPFRNNYAVVEVPEGQYFTQCAEFCGTAHAYMRAQFDAIPEDEFNTWVKEEKLKQVSGGNLITVTDTSVDPTSVQAVAGAKFTYIIQNEGTSEVTATYANASTGPIAPGSFAWLNATSPTEGGTYDLTIDGQTVTVEVIEPERIAIELDRAGSGFVIRPDQVQLEAGQAYLFEVVNVDTTVHNLYIGTPEEEGGTNDVLWRTPDMQPGDAYDLLVIPEETGTLTTWCDIPGHYTAGMIGELSVQ